MTGRPLALVVGAGQVGAGHLVPALADAGWDVVVAARSRGTLECLRATGTVVLETITAGDDVVTRRVRRVGVVDVADDAALGRVLAAADLVCVSVGPDDLAPVGRRLAPLLRRRLDVVPGPLNIVAFENHRRAGELLAGGLLDAEPGLGAQLGTRLGVAGAVLWRVCTGLRAAAEGLTVRVDDEPDTFLDRRALVPGAAPLAGVPAAPAAWQPVEPFDAWVVDKLWVFNAGHAAAAYLGLLAGADTVADAVRVPWVRAAVEQVLRECRAAADALHPAGTRRLGTHRATAQVCLDRYARRVLHDPVHRVGRDPRRKLAPGDRLVGPATTALDAGRAPRGLARVMAAALMATGPAGAAALHAEVAGDGAAEVLATLCGLDPRDELSRMVRDELGRLAAATAEVGDALAG